MSNGKPTVSLVDCWWLLSASFRRPRARRLRPVRRGFFLPLLNNQALHASPVLSFSLPHRITDLKMSDGIHK